MDRRPTVLIHGYSDKGNSFENWVNKLSERGYDRHNFHVCSYETLTNEVTIQDIAEGFDRALRDRVGLNNDEEFDAIVHSTGMLIIRSWLTVYAKRRSRLKHLIGLAPASFGSPLAHKGKSWLGGVFKGNKEFGPDFLEAGDRVLDGLELGSRFTWDLAQKDLIGEKTFYGPNNDTPYVFIFCGTQAYDGIRKLINEPGTDGTVRLAGCALNTRKIILDLTKNTGENGRIILSDWSNVDIPLIPVEDLNHGTILREPSDELVDMVLNALGIESKEALDSWYMDVNNRTWPILAQLTKWQQFVIRAVDERGDPITDYFIQLEGNRKNGDLDKLEEFDIDVHPYSLDRSLRNFHVNLDEINPSSLQSLSLHLIASSGSTFIAYNGFTDGVYDTVDSWHANLDLSNLLDESHVNFFYPFTTTLIELRLNREPLPLNGPNKLFSFII
ncbi:MAG: hypothetical protein K0S39_1500 [Paenibacillus sp.]|jgi:hypothetical protein|nr:hypothetical protein [Paenibacillus sp.]